MASPEACCFQPYVGDFRARQIAVCTGSAIVLAIALVFVRLMLSFEIAFGYCVMGYSWGRIGSDYKLRKGGLLPFGMLVLLVVPLVAAKVRRLL